MKKTLFVIFLFVLGTPVYPEDKDLRRLHHTAEAAMNTKDFAVAKEAYQRIFSKISSPIGFGRRTRVDWATYIDIGVRLAETHLALHEYEEGKQVLKKLLEKKPPSEYLPLIKLLQCRFCCSEQKPGEAFLLMKEIASQKNLHEWHGEDRSFFHSIEYTLNTYYDTLFQKAKRFHIAGSFDEAKKMYEEILEGIEKKYYPKACDEEDSLLKKRVRLRLAEVNFSLANYENTLSLLEGAEKGEDQIDGQMLYLAALVYQEKHAYEKTLDYLASYLHSDKRQNLEHFDQALFEMGIAYYRLGNQEKAKRYFLALQQPEVKQEKPAHLAAIYLARCFLKEKNPAQAEEVLNALAKRLSSRDPLFYEISYLRGKAAFISEKFENAADFFELSFPYPPFSGEWVQDALLHLGWCHLKLGDDFSKEEKVKEFFFSKAENTFNRLKKTKEHERACLSLARLYLLRKTHLNDAHALQKLELFLTTERPSFSSEGQLKALLLLAEATESYEKRETLYSQATEPFFADTASYAEAWYYRGLNHFQEGLSKPSSLLFEKAIVSFEEALSTMHQDPHKKAQILKWEAEANFHRNAPEEAMRAFDKLLSEFPLSAKEKEEVLYLRGLMASYLPGEEAFLTATSSLKKVVEQFPEGVYAVDALYVLGTLHFKKKDYETARQFFLQLAEQSQNERTVEGLFWSAECMEKSGDPPVSLRQRIYREYPRSPYAEEAYFRLFSLNAYIEGENEALEHLKNFSRLFPNSPLRIAAGYLLGIHASLFDEAYLSFEESEKVFLSLAKTPSFPLVYFYYRSRLERALLTFQHPSRHVDALPLFQTIVDEFSHDHPLTRLFLEKHPYPSIFEESEFGLGCALLRQKRPQLAQEIFSRMLGRYASAGISEGYYLSRTWTEQGHLALTCGDPETALRCFKMAEECGKDFLSIDQKLALWIAESDCHRGLKNFDVAMRMLSQVINEDVASPLRIKAMLLRAEIYALQGRHELAIRQLEATAKKGGEWALHAKEKLKVTYGIE